MADLWVVWLVCCWFVGFLAGLWMVWGWFGGGLGGLWVIWLVWQVCGWFRVLQLTEHETVFLKRRSLILSLVVGSI